MDKNKDVKLQDSYYAIAGARANSNAYNLDTLACYAVAMGDQRALVELLDIAPEYYTNNKGVKNAVDSIVWNSPASAKVMHLKALREVALVAEAQKENIAQIQAGTPKELRESNGQFVKKAIANRSLYSSIISSVQAELIAEYMSSMPNEKRIEDAHNRLEDAENNYKKYNLAGLDTVQGMLTVARDKYLEESKSAGYTDSLISKANAHLLDKDFCLTGGEENYGLLGLVIASKVNGNAEVDYFLNRCKHCDHHITDNKYHSYMNTMQRSYIFSPDFVDMVETGSAICEYDRMLSDSEGMDF